MPIPVTKIVDVQINLQSVGLQGEAFGTALIMGDSNRMGGDLIRFYSSITEVAADFHTNDPEYLAAQSYFSQTPTPVQVAIGKATAPVAQQDTITILTADVGKKYDLTLSSYAGTLTVSYTAQGGDTPTDVAAALVAAVVAAGVTPTYTIPFYAWNSGALEFDNVGAVITAGAFNPQAGFKFDATTSLTGADITIAVSTPGNGIQDDINAILTAGHTSDWYGLLLANGDLNDQAHIFAADQAAFLVESLNPRHWFMAQFGLVQNTGNMLISFLKFNRTAWMYTASYATYPAASVMAIFSASQPGSVSGNLKALPGIAPDNITPSDINKIVSNNGNYYTSINGNGSLNVFIDGRLGSGQWIDNLVGCDFIANSMTIDILNYLQSQPKVPYTDAGISALANIVKKWLTFGVNILLFTNNPKPTITQTPASQVSSTLKTARKVDSTVLTFAATLANAINTVQITGTVSN